MSHRSGGRNIRVLTADDQMMVRTGFRLILNAQPGIEVVAEASDGAEAVELARRLRPDVCLFDVRMPKLNGIDATRLLAGPGVPEPMRVVVVTTFDLDEYVYGALQAGACGFLLKDSGEALLVEAVRAAHAGEALVSPAVTVRLLEHLATPMTPGADADTARLTDRERDVVRLVAHGRSNPEIAEELYLSLSTVKGHLANVQTKTAARNRVEVAAWAWKRGLNH